MKSRKVFAVSGWLVRPNGKVGFFSDLPHRPGRSSPHPAPPLGPQPFSARWTRTLPREAGGQPWPQNTVSDKPPCTPANSGDITESGPPLLSALGSQGSACSLHPEVPTRFLLQGLQEPRGEGLGLRLVSSAEAARTPSLPQARGSPSVTSCLRSCWLLDTRDHVSRLDE
ncbi:hypothetical protein HPG69_014504 [Diceros bicornis minor]|uniref:Uncharacterized protein n=1 Tax=Diceros bicornis minor TaxID=77932 RepID=A0A7J7EX12_DICBM|nr:hypothetical protein HPG69_014504 [Diceros bicornis minor]